MRQEPIDSQIIEVVGQHRKRHICRVVMPFTTSDRFWSVMPGITNKALVISKLFPVFTNRNCAASFNNNHLVCNPLQVGILLLCDYKNKNGSEFLAANLMTELHLS